MLEFDVFEVLIDSLFSQGRIDLDGLDVAFGEGALSLIADVVLEAADNEF